MLTVFYTLLPFSSIKTFAHVQPCALIKKDTNSRLHLDFEFCEMASIYFSLSVCLPGTVSGSRATKEGAICAHKSPAT